MTGFIIALSITNGLLAWIAIQVTIIRRQGDKVMKVYDPGP